MEGNDLPEGYKESYYQDLTYRNSAQFLNDYCRNCQGNMDGCKIEEGMRLAMGDNYPYGHKSLVIVRPTDICSLFSDEKVHCKEFKSKQLEFEFDNNKII